MLNAISRYGVRVIPNTVERIRELEQQRQLIDGPHVSAFERAFSNRLDGRSSIATSHGRMAFFYILRALRFPEGSEIVMPALTFWVMPEMARQAGLRPVFADVDPVTFNLTAETVARVLTPRTVAVVPTHMWGLPCDMDPIVELAQKRRLMVIEDCAHALGAMYRGRPAGTLGDAAIFSFQTLKPLNAYGGGMAVVGDLALAARVSSLVAAEPAPSVERVRGKLWKGRVLRIATRPSVFTWTLFPLLYGAARLRRNVDMYFWEKIRPLHPLPEGYSERFSNVQAALALDGLALLDDWTRRRQLAAARMSDQLRHVAGMRVPFVPADRTHVFYQYCAYVPARDAVVGACLARGVDIETLHVDLCTDMALFSGHHAPAPGATETTRTVQIPVYESLSDEQRDRVAAVVSDAVRALHDAAPAAVHQS